MMTLFELLMQWLFGSRIHSSSTRYPGTGGGAGAGGGGKPAGG